MTHHTSAQDVLPDTQPLHGSVDYAEALVTGINRLLDQELAKADAMRLNDPLLSTDNPTTQLEIAAKRRERLAKSLGVVDSRIPIGALTLHCTNTTNAKIAEADGYDVFSVRWPVLAGVDGEGLLLTPRVTPVARVIALPDADQRPEDVAGLSDALTPPSQFARYFADAGCEVVIPTLINRECTWSGNPEVRMTNQPHREFVYRMAYEMGRHVIGYEIQKVLSLVDYFSSLADADVPIGVFGYGEGGLLSLYSGALDPRITAVGVSGYFRNRTTVWQEPIYRNVWQLLRGLSDAELAAMIAPRPLVIENSSPPAVSGPPPENGARRGAAPGVIAAPSRSEVSSEVELVRKVYSRHGVADSLVLVDPEDAVELDRFGTFETRKAFLQGLGLKGEGPSSPPPLTRLRSQDDGDARQQRQFDQLCQFTHQLWEASAKRRVQFWEEIDRTSPAACERSLTRYRQYFDEEVTGAYPTPSDPLSPKSRLLESNKAYALYEVVIDLWEGVPSFGYFLVPTGVHASSPRPVVVCQHGLGGDPAPIIDDDSRAYKGFGRRLAERGYIVYVPQAPFVGPMGDDFRVLQRKANPLGLSLFSFIVPQHRRILAWLRSLPYVDGERIALYGLSYGGKTAMRVPALVKEYALSICSGDFNEWIMKNVSRTFFSSYMFTGEYEMFEFDLGHTFNYAEMAYLISPRPFMVERGHSDGCSTDEWVAFEFAKVRRHYTRLGLRDRTEIEFFDGGHEINAEGTFAFLDRHLQWSPPAAIRTPAS